MRWPWVRRSLLSYYRRHYNDATTRAVAAEAARDELRACLERSERERTDLQLKLLRVGFGINPFAEMFVPDGNPAQPAESFSADTPIDTYKANASMSPEEVQRTFTREGMELYGSNIRQVRNHVEKRQAEFYANRPGLRHSVAPPEDIEAANQAQRDIEAAIEEGRQEALKG